MRVAGYGEPCIARVQSLVRKERLKRDAEVQALEDVVCLVFLEHYFEDFAAKHSDEKVVDILRKTWGKMSEKGRDAALEIELPERASKLLNCALTGEDQSA